MTPSELDQLADYAEGLLDGTPEGAEVAARVVTDQEWADAYRQLTAVLPDVSAGLAALPELPMPAEVAAALDRALAAEPSKAVAGDSDEESAGPRTAPADLARVRAAKADRDRAARRWRTAGGWVAAAAVVGAFCVGAGQLITSDSDDAGDSAASSAQRDSEPKVLSAPVGPPVSASGTSYSTGRLEQQARAVLGRERQESESTTSAPAPGGSSPTAEEASVAVPAALRRLVDPTDFRACLTALGITGEPLAVDYATLDGAPALVVLSEDPADATRLVVVAAGAECGVGGASDERARTAFVR